MEAQRKATALIRKTEGGVRIGVVSGAGVMLADLPADVVRMDSRRIVEW